MMYPRPSPDPNLNPNPSPDPNPHQYIKRYPRADVLMSSDMLHSTLGYNHTGLEDQGGFGPDFNIG